ncbi:MAG: hypothetical protein HUU38_05780 [Anaerolineales bacterium]|jgi:hypothetical protein|nr:hypothetical protein [Anaerolineales bacterium]
MSDEFEDFPEEDEPSSDQVNQTPQKTSPDFRERMAKLRENRVVWQGGKFLYAFWTIASTISMATTVVLIIVLIVLLNELFTLKALIGDQLLGGLQVNFEQMDAATIETTVIVEDTITVDDTIPVQFTLTLNQNTNVILTENTTIPNTIVTLNGVQVPTNIILPAGASLPIALNMDVPVDQTIPILLEVPVHLEVPVSIPLEDTELHEPFTGLQGVVAPYNGMLAETPNSWCEAGWLLCALFGKE